MVFSSYPYIFLFLPISLILYFLLNHKRLTLASKVWLVFASLFFYGWWDIRYLPLIILSIIFNFAVGTAILKQRRIENDAMKNANSSKKLLAFAICVNLAILGYFKYVDFFLSNINDLTNSQFRLLSITIPLGISFFTFTQIAYLVDTYKREAKEYSFVNYSLFVTYFPHLLAGPIIYHKEMMPQFDRIKNKVLDYKNLSIGIYLFFIGFFKKIVVADSFAIWANKGFDHSLILSFSDAWVTTLSYSMQLYFDFSGYTDMALGSSWMFNIKLPINFNSPYNDLLPENRSGRNVRIS